MTEVKDRNPNASAWCGKFRVSVNARQIFDKYNFRTGVAAMFSFGPPFLLLPRSLALVPGSTHHINIWCSDTRALRLLC